MQAAPAQSLVARRAAALLSALAAVLAFAPLIFLRYEFGDGWGVLYILNAREAMGCLERHEHSYLIGRPLYPAAMCAMTAFGRVLDVTWVPKLEAFLALFAAGMILASELRRAGAGAAVAAACVLSLLFLPGTLLMVGLLSANPIALGVLAATAAGYLWVKRVRRPAGSRAGRAVRVALAAALLVASMAIYQIVATMFFAPVLIALLFAPPAGSRAALRFALGAVLAFAAASAIYLAAHHALLYGFRYFFIPPHLVAEISSTIRSASVDVSPAHLVEKIRHLGALLPQIGTLWFVSEWAPYSRPAALAAAAAAGAAALALLAPRPGGLGRLAAVAVVAAAFFAPYFASGNAGNHLYSSHQRVFMFMQVPVVLAVWWLVHRLATAPGAWKRRAAGAAAAAVFAGAALSWNLIVRAFVIPSYMELKHIEPRLRDAVRRDVRIIYFVSADPAHFGPILGIHGTNEWSVISFAYVEPYMLTAILAGLEPGRPMRPIDGISPERADAMEPGPDRLILDLRRYP
jgi:hypothetical protein